MKLQCPNSLLVYFPEDLYRNVGSSTVLPQLLEILDADKLDAVQFLQNGIVRLTFTEAADCEGVLEHGLEYDGVSLYVCRAGTDVRSVYVRDLPIEVPDDDVSAFLATYGTVLDVRRSTYSSFPTVCDGNRIVALDLDKDIPCFVKIGVFNCRVWYSQQPPQCTVCRETGHRARNCPLAGLCRRCHQPGHMARECDRAWGPTIVPEASDNGSDTTPDDAADAVDPTDHVDDDDIAEFSSDSDSPSTATVVPRVPRVSSATPDATVSANPRPPSTVPVVIVPDDNCPQTSAPEGSVPSDSRPSTTAPVAPVNSRSSAAARVPQLSPWDSFFRRPDPSSDMLQLRKYAKEYPRLKRVICRIGHLIDDSVLRNNTYPLNSGSFFTYLEKLADQYASLRRKNT